MVHLNWYTCGEGDRNLVLLHGWGLNMAVWRCMINRLAPHFRLHLVDLPGYGRSIGYGAISLTEMSELVLKQAPEKALWLGWSMGGLVASQIALRHPERVIGLITVSSSPCFSSQGTWPGIKSEVLIGFQQQCSRDFHRTMERFMALQTMSSASAREDARLLKSAMLNHQNPAVEVFNGGLEILRTADLRTLLADFSRPFLRIYGYLDSIVPRKVATLLDNLWPQTQSIIIKNAAHVPFLSHPDEFATLIINLSQRDNLFFNSKNMV